MSASLVMNRLLCSVWLILLMVWGSAHAIEPVFVLMLGAVGLIYKWPQIVLWLPAQM